MSSATKSHHRKYLCGIVIVDVIIVAASDGSPTGRERDVCDFNLATVMRRKGRRLRSRMLRGPRGLACSWRWASFGGRLRNWLRLASSRAAPTAPCEQQVAAQTTEAPRAAVCACGRPASARGPRHAPPTSEHLTPAEWGATARGAAWPESGEQRILNAGVQPRELADTT